jgi:hypothetical protein
MKGKSGSLAVGRRGLDSRRLGRGNSFLTPPLKIIRPLVSAPSQGEVGFYNVETCQDTKFPSSLIVSNDVAVAANTLKRGGNISRAAQEYVSTLLVLILGRDAELMSMLREVKAQGRWLETRSERHSPVLSHFMMTMPLLYHTTGKALCVLRIRAGE